MTLHIFWDNSNIWLVGREVCRQKEPGEQDAFRIHFANLLDFASDGRVVDFAFLGGSIPPETDLLWQRFNDLDIKVEKQERGQGSGGEVAVDEIIQLQMANCVLDIEPPGIMVLLTGDGSGYHDGRGFIRQLERAHKRGWEIEVISWDIGCNRRLKEFANNHGKYRPLEPVYKQVTYVNNKRWAKGF